MTDLVFRGTVEQIGSSPVGKRGAFLDWVVQMRVDEVLSGVFDGTRFEFRIHSPARSGLRVGLTCTVTATWTGTGYRVDDNQWHGAP